MEQFKDRFIELMQFLLYPISVFLFEYLSIDQNLVEILSILMLIDSVAGSYKSIRLGYKWTIGIFIWGIVSKIAILFVPVILALVARAIDYDFGVLVYLIMALMIVGESLSSISNIYSGKYKIKLEKFDVIQEMFKALRVRLKKTALVLLNQIEGENDCAVKSREPQEKEIEREEEELKHNDYESEN